MIKWINDIILKRRVRKINQIVDAIQKRLVTDQMMLVVNSLGKVTTLEFECDGALDQDLVNDFISMLRLLASNMLTIGVSTKPSEAVTLAIWAVCDTLEYNKMYDPSNITTPSYVG